MEFVSGRFLVDRPAVEVIVGALVDASAQVDQDSTLSPLFGPQSCGAAFADQVAGYRTAMAGVADMLVGIGAEAGTLADTVRVDLGLIETVDRTSDT